MASRTGTWRSHHAQLAAVAALFLLAQVVLVRDVPLGWDESIYASQTDPRRPALGFTAPRARGTSLVAAPLQLVSGSPVALRVYLAVLAALGLYAAYAVWLRLMPNAAVPLAALGFSTLWVTVFYGPTTMPNVLLALAGLFATGALVCTARGRAPRWLPWAGGAAIALATLARPIDVVPLDAALAVVVLVHRPWRSRAVRLLAPAALGSVAGAVPWLVEAQLRYGGIWPRTRRALSTQGTGERFVPDYQLRSFDGPLLCRPCVRESQPIPLPGVLFWVVGAALVVVAVWLAWRHRRSGGVAATLVPAFVGGSLAVPYLLLVGYAAPRFLLPAYALLALPAGQALRHLVKGSSGAVRPVVAGLAAVLFLGHLAVQHTYLERNIERENRARESWVRVARGLASQGVVPPCTLVGGQANALAYVARCDAVTVALLPGDEQFTAADLSARIQREPVALVLRGAERPPAYARDWSPVPKGVMPPGYRAFLPPDATR